LFEAQRLKRRGQEGDEGLQLRLGNYEAEMMERHFEDWFEYVVSKSKEVYFLRIE
jgi:guanylate kinase